MTQGANGFWRYKPETNTITAVLETDQGIINYEILDHGDSLLVLRPIW